MAEVIQVCSRSNQPSVTADDIQRLSERFLPDNFSPDLPLVIEGDGYLLGVLNPRGIINSDTSVGLGAILDENWDVLGASPPSGSYAIFRNDSTHTEVVTDIVGSRTIWYGHTEDLFVASTLQRAVVAFIEQFTPDPETQAWMLSAGILGPYRSWAQEVEQLRPNSVLRLDRESWEWEINHQPASFDPVSRSRQEHYQSLLHAIEETFSDWSVSPSTDILTLSGGYDSRALLHNLANEYPAIETITWGTADSIDVELNDADIAQRLAQSYNVEHRFVPLDTDSPSPETVIERFIQAGEGRTDHLSGYLDGFELWNDIHSEGIERIIRGDEGFGWIPPITKFTTESHVRRANGLTMVTERSQLASFDLPEQKLPSQLERGSQERIGDWRDRLYHDARIPTTLAALNGLKSPYVELSNPLLSKEIIESVRQLPVESRDDKALFTQYVNSISPDVPYATQSANPSLSLFLSHPDTVEYLDSELNRAAETTSIPPDLVRYTRQQIEPSGQPSASKPSSTQTMGSRIKQHLPRTAIDLLKRFSDGNQSVDVHRLAFRIVIVSRMNELLHEDAALRD